MEVLDKELTLHLTDEFTSLKDIIQKFIIENDLSEANLVCFVPHEVSSLVQIGWEDGLLDDLREFLNEICPSQKYTHHDEPGTPFRHNFHEHIKTKLIGNISMTLLVKSGELYLGKYQALYFYSPVWKHIPDQKIVIRIMKFS